MRFIEKGDNNNINRLIRRFWKKGTDFNTISDSEVLEVQNKINNMQREIFNCKSSLEIYQKYI
ncbi:IS1630 transposase [Metamycoplasma arthritidis 158L3-1]|uniref:IS1630 transposase n=1 Tax=Metamycoplasma arthritidis (strain 158L3-1) TaxID=243272 RepID=B3PM64_META1|nr:IS1630 transposase [Metamycoplasma arthritidis 158L3-1]